jgi:hypothetical protein
MPVMHDKRAQETEEDSPGGTESHERNKTAGPSPG